MRAETLKKQVVRKGRTRTKGVRAATRLVADDISLVTYDSISGLREIWHELEADGNASVYQRFDWVEICLKSLESGSSSQPLIVVGYYQDRPAFIFPLVICGRVLKKLRWIGGSHSNYNMPLFSNEFLEHSCAEDIRKIFRRIIRMVPGIFMVKLCCQPQEWAGWRNPFLHVDHSPSMNPAFEMSLEGGLDGVLGRANRKRKKKKFRSQERFCEPYGGYRLLKPTTTGEALRLMDVFREQKAVRFRQLGIRNVFGSYEARQFLGQLATHSVESKSPVMRLYGLEVGGAIRAVYGGGISGNRLSGYFSSISNDEFAQMSPGEMLLYLLIEDCAEAGFEHLDLGAGDERYKRSWCPERIELFDTIVAVSLFSHPVVWVDKALHIVKRKVRSDAKVWEAVRRIRRMKGSIQSYFRQ